MRPKLFYAILGKQSRTHKSMHASDPAIEIQNRNSKLPQKDQLTSFKCYTWHDKCIIPEFGLGR